MAKYKYLFYVSTDKITAFDFDEKENLFKTIPYNFKDYYSYRKNDIHYFEKYLKWLDKKIAKDDSIDFCFLFEDNNIAEVFSFEHFERHKKNSISSWNKEDIRKLCKEKFSSENFKIHHDEDNYFYAQNVNVGNSNDNVKNLYLKCIPQFSVVNEQPTSNNNDSYVYGYFHDKLMESLRKYTS